MEVMTVANVEAAIALATSLQNEKRYNWFRGQVRDWQPASSLERKIKANADDYQKYQTKLARFVAWAKEQPALAYLADPKNVDSLFAVLQHYGFPTCYVDFTTDPSVAGFFASDCVAPPDESGNCVIYCLNTDDLSGLYKLIGNTSDEERWRAEPVSLDVSNLWRLQAQHGHFLFVNHAWYHVYDMDRIEFPWTGYPAYPTKDQIYPQHKSALEQLMDQYFFNERMHDAYENLSAWKQEQAAKGAHSPMWMHVNNSVAYDEAAFSLPPAPLPEWSEESLKNWMHPPDEEFNIVVGRQVRFQLRDGGGAPCKKEQVIEGVRNALRRQPDLRRQAVEWIFQGLPDSVEEGRYSRYVRSAWNGMRNLPYSDDDIAVAFGSLIELCAIPECQSTNGHEMKRAFNRWISDSIEVEFCTEDGAYSRGFCSQAGLLAAHDQRWKRELLKKYSAISATEAFVLTHDPRLMFDFGRLASVFAREVIPSQLVRDRDLVLFNLAQLTTFGLP